MGAQADFDIGFCEAGDGVGGCVGVGIVVQEYQSVLSHCLLSRDQACGALSSLWDAWGPSCGQEWFKVCFKVCSTNSWWWTQPTINLCWLRLWMSWCMGCCSPHASQAWDFCLDTGSKEKTHDSSGAVTVEEHLTQKNRERKLLVDSPSCEERHCMRAMVVTKEAEKTCSNFQADTFFTTRGSQKQRQLSQAWFWKCNSFVERWRRGTEQDTVRITPTVDTSFRRMEERPIYVMVKTFFACSGSKMLIPTRVQFMCGAKSRQTGFNPVCMDRLQAQLDLSCVFCRWCGVQKRAESGEERSGVEQTKIRNEIVVRHREG